MKNPIFVWLVFCHILAALGLWHIGKSALNSLSHNTTIIPAIGKKYIIAASSGAEVEIYDDQEMLSIAGINSEKRFFMVYIGSGRLEITAKGGSRFPAVTDTDGDGVPNYRIIHDEQTGRPRKEILGEISWVSSDPVRNAE
jgi:hypothetical protein